MTMLTRCAACGTAFRITTDQLVSRQGKVRCGNCAAVFNALDRLIPEPAQAQPGDAVRAENPPASAEPSHGSYDLFSAAPHAAGTHGATVPIASTLLLPKPAPRGFPWWSLLGVLSAGVALAAQGAWFYRNQLGALYPQTKPALERACAELGCKLEAPVDAQSISIESSDLQADTANRAVLVLSAVLRNRAPFAQGLPLLELALTDALDAPLARRVLKPSEYAPGPASASIAAGSEFQFRMFIDAGQLKANGYRLYAFYP